MAHCITKSSTWTPCRRYSLCFIKPVINCRMCSPHDPVIFHRVEAVEALGHTDAFQSPKSPNLLIFGGWKFTRLKDHKFGSRKCWDILGVSWDIYIYIYLFIYIYISNGCLSFNMFLALTSCKSEPLYKKMFFLAPLHKRWFQEKMNSLDPAIVLKIRRSGVWFLADYLTFSGPPPKKKTTQTCIYWDAPPPRIPVANIGIPYPLLKQKYKNPGGHWNPGWGATHAVGPPSPPPTLAMYQPLQRSEKMVLQQEKMMYGRWPVLQ